MDEIITQLDTHGVLMVSGPTGSGKSTKVPQLLLEHYVDKKVVVAQPRRLGAECLCARMREMLSPELVGLRMGFGIKDEYPETRLWYMTVGYLVRVLINDLQYLKSGDILVFDEIHEAGLDQDLLCFLAREMRKNGVKLVLMSATINLDHYHTYFGQHIPRVTIGKKPFPISVYYLDDLDTHPDVRLSSYWRKKLYRDLPLTQQIDLAVELVCSFQESALIFVAGLKDLYTFAEKFKEKGIPTVLLHSQIERKSTGPFENTDQFQVYIGTNIAESSITIPDLNLVLCLGQEKFVEDGVLKARHISRASATQRAGRTGRTCQGTVLRLYTYDTYESFMPYHVSYSAQNLPQIILQLEAMTKKFRFTPTEILTKLPTPVEEVNLIAAYDELKSHGMIVDDTITTYGRFAIKVGLQLEYVAILALGCKLGCGTTAAALVAALLRPPYVRNNYLDENYFEKVRTYTKNRHDVCATSEPLYNLKRYLKKPKKFRQIGRVVKTLKEHVSADTHQPSDKLLTFILGTCLKKYWLTGKPATNFKEYSLEIKDLPKIVGQDDPNVHGVYSILYEASTKQVFEFMDEDQESVMANKALVTEDEVCTWHPEVVFNYDDQMHYIDVIFKRRNNTNRVMKKLKKKKVDLMVTQKDTKKFEFVGLEPNFGQPVVEKKLISHFLHVSAENMSYATMFLNTVARGYRDGKFRTHSDATGIKFRFPRTMWKWSNGGGIMAWLPNWESSVVGKTVAVADRLLLSEQGTSGRAFSITFLDDDVVEAVETVPFPEIINLAFDETLLANVDEFF
jgi:HrpA-like RNA helicase